MKNLSYNLYPVLLLLLNDIIVIEAYHGKGSKGSNKRKWKCKDDSDYEFDTEFTGMQDCTWLSEKEDRQDKYCETKGWENTNIKKVKYGCRETCALYLEAFEECEKFLDDDYYDDVVDDDGYDNPDCNDDADYEFSTESGDDQDCDWLAEKTDRQEKYCETFGWDYDANKKVKYACQDACEDFLDEICKKPEDRCVDDDDYEFETEFVETKDCQWLSEKVDRQEKYCELKGWDESAKKKVKFGCKKSCSKYNFCASHTPSMVPSINSYVPSVVPIITPSTEPSGEFCSDDDDYKFKTEFAGKVDCEWLSEKESRQAKYCESKGWDGNAVKKVKFACRESCSDFNDKC